MADIFQEERYVLVGGFAVILHGHARVTGDMDIWVERTESNYDKLLNAFKFGRKPVAIDIMTKVKGLDFKECYDLSTEFEVDDLKVRTLHVNHLIEAKKKAGRLKDLDDIEQLIKK